MTQGRIAVLVSNDLAFDQRVRKTCATLMDAGWEPVLIGRRMSRGAPLSIDRPYVSRRMWLGFHKGPMFYAALQWKMYRALKALDREGGVTAVWANDLDTLWPALKAARKFGWRLAYDSHEWFTEAEGLQGKPGRRAVWRWWERRCFRGIDRMLTVNSAIAEAYKTGYGVSVDVVPNVPEMSALAEPLSREFLGWPEGEPVLLMQGAFMDRDRGALDAVRALALLERGHLALIGAGPEHEAAPALAEKLGVRDRLHIHERMPFEQLRRCTPAADVGLSLDRSTVGNFKFSLPNKLFDYLHAGIPVVCSDLPVAGRLVREEEIGEVAAAAVQTDAIAVAVADAVKRVLEQKPERDHLLQVAQRYHWGAHTDKLLAAIHEVH
ncbi:MAG: glycosyltransferase [Flavobacteriales bacterium]|nr:glycosyltransferase [Flavobacteriales bacterium]